MKIGAIGAAAAVAVVLGASGRGASAEVIVIGSDFEAYPIGSRLPDDDPNLIFRGAGLSFSTADRPSLSFRARTRDF